MNFLSSSIGKKIQVAVTGIFLSMFLLFHLLNNMVLFTGAENFNNMVLFLESIKPVIRIVEIVLLLVLIIHTLNAISLTLKNKQLKSQPYHIKQDSTSSSLNSRTMAISGSVILLFLIIHLFYIWGTYQAHSFINNQETYYDVILRSEFGYLNHTPTAIFYIISIILIGFHLKHGFESALKTLGVLNRSKGALLYQLGVLFWGIIPMGFIIIIISIQLGFIK